MSYTIGVIAFVVALLASVMLHEAGHFLTAKHYGMKASRFFLGFGPTLWSFRRGETEYGVKALPAGGFVKIEGMTALEEMPPGEESRAFHRQPAGQRAVVLAAGSTVHFIIAIFLVFGVIAATHKDPVAASISIDRVGPCVPAGARTQCLPSDPKSPAVGVLQRGDIVTGINGVSTDSPDRVGRIIQAHPGEPVTLDVRRDGKPITVTVVPAAVNDHGRTIGRIGITQELVAKHVSLASSVPRTFGVLGDFVTSTVHALGGLPHEVAQIFQGEKRSANSAASIVDVGRVSGQIASSGASTGSIVATLLLIVAELNLFVGIFNLLPLLPLDGGHIAILAFEEARSRAYRLFGRRDPGRVDIMKVLPLTYAVVAVFVGLSLILLYAGITNPITLQ
ncbi:MAG TPA: site-2 protease family protein [Mycobacteriales bacterium]|nr:site-2 protease family protein [Mycobacteriales bacterium]